MKDMLNLIHTRRSIRKYCEKNIEYSQIKMLIESAMDAPSANNQQPWHFVIVTDKRLLQELSGCNGGYTMLKEAPLAILVCGEPGKATLPHFWPLDCAAATQNILLASHAIGLGAVWLGAYPAEEHVASIRHILNVPQTVVPFALIAVGYPAEEKVPTQRYIPDRIHYNNVF